MKLEAGNYMTVFRDPVTKTKIEGRAKLVKLIIDDLEQQCWSVRFDYDDHDVERWINMDAESSREVKPAKARRIKLLHGKYGRTLKIYLVGSDITRFNQLLESGVIDAQYDNESLFGVMVAMHLRKLADDNASPKPEVAA